MGPDDAAPVLTIAGRKVGPGHPTLVVAEISGNHGGSYDKAMLLVDAAAQAKADAVKFQLYRPEDMAARENSPVLAAGPWAGQSLWDLYERAKTPPEWLPDLFAAARERNLIPFASVFAPWAVDRLEGVDCPAYKIASLEIGETDLITYAGATRKPLLLSTGRATAEQVADALLAARAWIPQVALLEAEKYVNRPLPEKLAAALTYQIALLHCLAAYPAPYQAMNLRAVTQLRTAFPGCVVGLSDHSRQPLVAEIAVALGASIIEAHFMLPLDTAELPPLDADFSLQPVEFEEMVTGVRIAEQVLGSGVIGPQAAEAETAEFARRWHYAVPGFVEHVIEAADLRSLRGPEGILHSDAGPIGATLRRDVRAGDPVRLEDFV